MGALKDELRWWDIGAFVAHQDIEPTREWVGEIEAALSTCNALLAYLTPTFPESRWCDQEVGYCVARHVLIVPVRAGLDPYGFIGRYQAVPGSSSAAELVERIVRALLDHPLTSPRIAACLVRRLEVSNTYNTTRRVMALIERVPAWTPELLRRLEAAAQHNDQVSAAILQPSGQAVPERIRELVSEHST